MNRRTKLWLEKAGVFAAFLLTVGLVSMAIVHIVNTQSEFNYAVPGSMDIDTFPAVVDFFESREYEEPTKEMYEDLITYLIRNPMYKAVE